MAVKLKAHSARRHEAQADEAVNAPEAQNVAVIGTGVVGIILPHLAHQLITPHTQRRNVAAEVEALVGAHPLYRILTSMPGIGVRTATVFIIETLRWSFDTEVHLVSYAGLAPVTRRSGSSIRGKYTSHAGNKRLKQAMFLSVFASLRSGPVSRAYYDYKIAQGRRHSQAVVALARHRILTLYAMIRNTTLYNPQPIHQLPTVA